MTRASVVCLVGLLSLVLAMLMAGGLATSAYAADPSPDPRPDPNACRLLTDDDLAPLLFNGAGGTLDSWTGHPAPGLSTCKWEARPRDLAITTPPRTASLHFYHFATPERAQAQLDSEPKGVLTPSSALLSGDDDALVRPGPVAVVARHGADVTVLDASGAELSNPAQMETRYLLDALALKAAGAKVSPPPWTSSTGPAEATTGWTPPAHPTPSWALPLQPLLHLVHKLALWRFFVLPVLVLAGLGIGGLLRSCTDSSSRPRSHLYAPGVCIGLAVVNIVFGPNINSALLHHLGESGSAQVIGSRGTSTQYNNHDVIAYDVLIRTPKGKVVKTGFQDDDFNIYPSGNAVSYPSEGTAFTARYLPMFPKDFVIVADDVSPWASGLRCADLLHADTEARSKLRFAPGDAAFQAAATKADTAFTAAGCKPA